MTKRNSIIILSVLAAAFLWYFNDPAPLTITNYPSDGTDIIAFGDSLVEGVGSTRGNDFVSLLSRRIGEPIVNLGRAGDTTAQGLARIGALDRYDPKVVILLLGGNDHLQKVPIATTFANLASLIENIQARGAVVLLLGIKGSLLSDKFAPEFELLQEKYNTAYVPNVLRGLFGRSELMYDSVHPNDKGYVIIADRIQPVLEKLIR